MSDADQAPRARSLPPPSPELVARARAFRDAGGQAAPAKPSATVILLRDGIAGPEVFMIRRLTAMAFAGGMHVFPGGVVDPADAASGDAEAALAVAAIRETFEETGILLADGPPADPEILEADRLALIAHRVTFAGVCARHGLTPRPHDLRSWAHWVTPDFEPRRYDTRFFVAIAPGSQVARDVGGESDAAAWVTPAKALEACANREWLLMPPTETTLRELLDFACAADIFESAALRDVRPLRTSIDLDRDPPRFVCRPES